MLKRTLSLSEHVYTTQSRVHGLKSGIKRPWEEWEEWQLRDENATGSNATGGNATDGDSSNSTNDGGDSGDGAAGDMKPQGSSSYLYHVDYSI